MILEPRQADIADIIWISFRRKRIKKGTESKLNFKFGHVSKYWMWLSSFCICINQEPITSNHGFTCECPAGTELQVADGIERCVDINECKTGQHHCGWLPCRDFYAHGSSDGVQGNAWWNENYTQFIFR